MTKQEILKNFESRFKADIVGVSDRSPKRLYIEIRPDAVVRCGICLFKELGARFSIASGVDFRDRVEILYHFTFDDVDLVVTLRVKLPKGHLEIDSLAPHFEAANWIEREIFELLGVKFRGHPELKRLLLPDVWPEGVFPLRRDYEEWDKTAIRDRGVK